MIEIQGKLVSLEVLENKFVCNLEACKGACCIEGDEGAPVTLSELNEIKDNIDLIIPYLDEEGKKIVLQKIIEEKGPGKYATPLKKDGCCVYAYRDGLGILHCGIETSNKDQKSTFLKPISCHLYPIRISTSEMGDWEALNYNSWDICNPACSLGEKLQMPVYQFLKNAILRKYGEGFYNELREVAEQYNNQKSS